MLRLHKRLLWSLRRSLSTKLEQPQPKKLPQFKPTKPEIYMQNLLDRESPLLKLSEEKVIRPPFIKTIYQKRFDERFLTYPDVLNNDRVDSVNDMYEKIKKYVDSLPADAMNEGAPAEVLKHLESLEVFKILLPYAEGGLELTMTELARIMEAFGSQPTLAAIVARHNIAGIYTLLRYGSGEYRSRLLDRLCAGQLVTAYAIEEETSGSTKTTATIVGSDCVLSGRKIFVCTGDRAEVFVVVSDFVGEGESGQATILVDRQLPGVTVETSPETAGLKGAGFTTVNFKDVKVAIDCVLGERGQRSKVAKNVAANVQTALSAAAIGTTRSAFDQAFKHTFNTQRFGSLLCALQLVREKLANMANEIYLMESNLYMTTAIEDVVLDPDLELESIASSLISMENSKRVLEAAIDVCGTKGYLSSNDGVRWLNDIVTSPYFGTTQREQRLLLARIGLQCAAEKMTGEPNTSLVKTKEASENNLQRLLKNFKKDGPDVNGELYQFLHPSLLESANILDFSQRQLSAICEKLLLKFGVDVIENRMVLNLLAGMTLHVFGLSNALARASRSYCIGLYNSYEEVKLCSVHAKTVNERFDLSLKELQAILAEGSLPETSVTASMFLQHKRYPALHPLQS